MLIYEPNPLERAACKEAWDNGARIVLICPTADEVLARLQNPQHAIPHVVWLRYFEFTLTDHSNPVLSAYLQIAKICEEMSIEFGVYDTRYGENGHGKTGSWADPQQATGKYDLKGYSFSSDPHAYRWYEYTTEEWAEEMWKLHRRTSDGEGIQIRPLSSLDEDDQQQLPYLEKPPVVWSAMYP